MADEAMADGDEAMPTDSSSVGIARSDPSATASAMPPPANDEAAAAAEAQPPPARVLEVGSERPREARAADGSSPTPLL